MGPPEMGPAVPQPGPVGGLPPEAAAPIVLPPPGQPPIPPMPPTPLPNPAPGRPSQAAIETAASVMEKALEIVVDDEHSSEAVKMAIKDTLLPGRGCCRVRWKPQMKQVPLPGGPLPDGTAPTEEIKVWEEVDDEYVYWEDLLVDPVRAAADMNWIAFRHLFTQPRPRTRIRGLARIRAAGRCRAAGASCSSGPTRAPRRARPAAAAA